MLLLASPALAQQPFAIEVLDSRTKRGVPLVEVVTTDGNSYFTDSNGIVAFDEHAQMNRDISVTFFSYGYTGFEKTLHPVAGGSSITYLDRVNRAERLYRVTGAGIYRDSIEVGRSAPIEKPLLNANVKGQDSVQHVIHKGEIYWFWGDTTYVGGGGNYRVSGATSKLPSRQGLDPSLGINLHYFSKDGRAREMMPYKKPGPIWLSGVFVVQPPSGGERIVAHFVRMKTFIPDASIYEHGMAIYSDLENQFVKLVDYKLDAPITPTGKPFELNVDGKDYIYFSSGYPNIRVARRWLSLVDIAQWEAFSPFRENSRYKADDPPLDIDAQGDIIYGWKKNTDPLSPYILQELVKNGHIKPGESPYDFMDFETGKRIRLASSSYHWNTFRNMWIMIGLQEGGESSLGEVWFSEAPTPEGPWRYAIKVATHHSPSGDYAFYAPTLLPFFDQHHGRTIYFMGTYSATPFGTAMATPLYDYNQIMYRLDLATIPSMEKPGTTDH